MNMISVHKKRRFKLISLAVGIVLVICASAIGGYWLGNMHGQQEQSASDNVKYDAVSSRADKLAKDNTELSKKFNDLADQYNTVNNELLFKTNMSNLTNKSTTSSTTSIPHISCSTMTYGINNQFTSTNCY
jgi:flagellar basal body-associated protein FliL